MGENNGPPVEGGVSNGSGEGGRERGGVNGSCGKEGAKEMGSCKVRGSGEGGANGSWWERG